MLYLLLYIDDDRYVIDATTVVEIIPLVQFKKIPKAADYVAGLMNYRGTPIPVIDFRRFTGSQDTTYNMCTRIILINYQMEDCSHQYTLGIIADRVTDTIMRNSAEFSESGNNKTENSYLSRVSTDVDGILQWIDVKRLVPDAFKNILFT